MTAPSVCSLTLLHFAVILTVCLSLNNRSMHKKRLPRDTFDPPPHPSQWVSSWKRKVGVFICALIRAGWTRSLWNALILCLLCHQPKNSYIQLRFLPRWTSEVPTISSTSAKGAFEWKNTLSTTSRHYEYTVMPYGISAIPSVFQCTINDMLRDMLGNLMIIYIDDILIYSLHWKIISHMSKKVSQICSKISFMSREKNANSMSPPFHSWSTSLVLRESPWTPPR